MHDDTELLGWQVAEQPYAAFDAWLDEQPEEVQELGLLEQIDVYYAEATADA